MINIMTKYGQYPGEYPQEPYRPSEPRRSRYVGTKAGPQTCIYQDYDYLREDMDVEEYWEDMEEKVPEKPTKGMYEQLSLQDILDLMPPGAEPKDIILDLSYPRYVDYIRLGFSHMKRDLAAEEAAYQKAMNEYQHELAVHTTLYEKYEKDLAAYQNWIKEQEVKELEQKLAELKK